MGVEGNAVVTSFNDFRTIEKSVSNEWERFQEGEEVLHSRSVILSSWERSKKNGVNPRKRLANMVYSDDALREQKEQAHSLIEISGPYMEKIFNNLAHEETVVTLSNHKGIIVSEKVSKNMWNKVEKYQFLPGADWSEEEVGTNAIGTTLIEGRPIQIFSSEHFCEGWHPWVCSSSPIKDPITNQILGVLNITGDKHLLKAHNIDLVINQARQIEQNIGLHLMQGQLLSLHSLFNSFKDPVVVFDLNGGIKQFNKAAKYLLNLSIGENVFDIPELKKRKEYNGFDGFFEVEGIKKNNALWDVKIYPYKYGERLLGGMALFEKRVQTKLTKKTNKVKYRFDDILTNNKEMLRIIDLAKKAAYSDLSMVVYGETGTGKELLVQSIHDFGMRSKKPFVAINCGAIPKDLIASELFGYEAGAFTGARLQGKKGKFQLANKGTIFLDEIGELSLEMQLYLLRVLEEKEVVPIGASKPVPIDVRVICATNKKLREEVEKGDFREDLYYRLHVISLTLPPLRKRKDDIPLLVNYFLSENEPEISINQGALNSLSDFEWPGNIRQLKNSIDQAMFNVVGDLITIDALQREIISNKRPLKCQKQKRKLNKELLLETLKETKGNITKAAKNLGVSRMTIYRKKEEFQIE